MTVVDFNRGIMEFRGADSPVAVAVSTGVLAVVVGTLIWWALSSAYTF